MANTASKNTSAPANHSEPRTRKTASKRKKYMERTIYTYFYDEKGIVLKINRSAHSRSAVVNAFAYMQNDYYKAKTVEVVNSITGLPLAVIAWKNMTLQTFYKVQTKELS